MPSSSYVLKSTTSSRMGRGNSPTAGLSALLPGGGENRMSGISLTPGWNSLKCADYFYELSTEVTWTPVKGFCW